MHGNKALASKHAWRFPHRAPQRRAVSIGNQHKPGLHVRQRLTIRCTHTLHSHWPLPILRLLKASHQLVKLHKAWRGIGH